MKTQLAGEITRAIRESFGVEHAPVLEVPPRRELGDLASPAAMQLARTLKRNPRAIAEELAGALRRPEVLGTLGILHDIRILGSRASPQRRKRRRDAARHPSENCRFLGVVKQ